MLTVTLSHGETYLASLLDRPAISAVRNHVLGMLCDALITDRQAPLADEIKRAATPLCSALGVEHVDDLPAALSKVTGRPTRQVRNALHAPELAAAVANGLDALTLLDTADRARLWSTETSAIVAGQMLPEEALHARAELMTGLVKRARKILSLWRGDGGVDLAPRVPIDGRCLASIARAWQVPLVRGELLPPPTATVALYPNRLGRLAAALAFVRAGAALDPQRCAPDAWVYESCALLVAVGDWIGGDGVRAEAASQVSPRTGRPMWAKDDELFQLNCWWPVFDSWGSQSKAVAKAVETAWKLTEVQADVLVWALCSVAARLATAASAPDRPLVASARPVPGAAVVVEDPEAGWPDHRVAELPTWEAGARSVWSLMLSTRRLEGRTPWPGCLEWSLDDASSWPWVQR